jgi:hypothetical protein
MASYVWRGFLTAVAFLMWSAASFIINVPATLITGQIAGQQFDNTNEGFVIPSLITSMFRGLGAVTTIFFVLVLIAIWWRPLKALVELAKTNLAILLLLCLFGADRPQAYYDKTDYAEVYFVLPNESAFFVPDAGANKDNQSSFGSVDYLNANKIPAKRFQIPHAKLAGSAFWADYFVPTGRLIIVDRTPYNREWVASIHRGTSAKDESFPCQSAEGLDVTVGISISAFVTEQDAAKFLYWFGVNPPQGDRSKPEVIFTSVFSGRSLAQVMDGVGRGKVQALVCNEIAARPLDRVNSDATTIMLAIQGTVATYLASRGITLDYIGWADTFSFDTRVQDAINRRYIADREKEIAEQLEASAPTVQALATAEATRTTANRWDGKLPSQVSLWWLPSALTDWLSGMGKK